MNFFTYLNKMKELGSIPALVGMGIFALFLIVIIVKMFIGIRRGTKRQIVHLLLTVAAAIISIGVATYLSNHIIGSLSSDNFQGLLEAIDGVAPGVGTSLLDTLSKVNNPEIIEYIILLPATLFVLPLLAALLFFVVNILFKIVYIIVVKILKFKKAKTSPERLGGAVLAAVEAIICMMVLFLPINGTLGLVDNVFETAIEAEIDDSGDLEEIYEEYLVPFTKNPAISFLNNMGGSKIADRIATVKINGEKTNIRAEITDATRLVLFDITQLAEADFKQLSAEEKVAVTNVINAVCDSEFMSNLMVGVVNTAASAIDSGEIPLSKGGDFQPVVEEAIAYIRNINTETLKEDLHTIKDLYFVILDSGVLTAIDDGQDIMTLLKEKSDEGDDSINKIKDILKANPRTNSMVTALTKSLVNSLIPEDTTIVVDGKEIEVSYETVKESVNEILTVTKENKTEEEFKDDLKDKLNKVLVEDNKIEIEDEEIIDGIVDHINENYDEIYGAVGDITGGGELTDEQFNDIIFSYLDAYLEYVNNSQGESNP